MPAIKRIEIICRHCGHLFDSHFLSVGSTEQLETIDMSGNLEQCPKCHGMTPCNAENMHIALQDGSVYRKP